MSVGENVEALSKLIELMRRLAGPKVEPERVLSNDYAMKIAGFVNTLWSNLKVPEDLKNKLVEMVLDYVLRALLGIETEREGEEEEDIPKSYVI